MAMGNEKDSPHPGEGKETEHDSAPKRWDAPKEVMDTSDSDPRQFSPPKGNKK